MKNKIFALALSLFFTGTYVTAQDDGDVKQPCNTLKTIGPIAIGLGAVMLGSGILDKIDQHPINSFNEPYQGYDSSTKIKYDEDGNFIKGTVDESDEVKEGRATMQIVVGGVLIAGGIAAIFLDKKKSKGGPSITMNEYGLGMCFRF